MTKGDNNKTINIYIISAFEVRNRIKEEDWYARDSQVMGGFRHVWHGLCQLGNERYSAAKVDKQSTEILKKKVDPLGLEMNVSRCHRK